MVISFSFLKLINMSEFILKLDLKYWFKVLSLWGSSILATWKIGNMYHDFTTKMAKYDLYDSRITSIDSIISNHENNDNSIHIALWTKVNALDTSLLHTVFNQRMRNDQRAYYNDTIKVHSIN